MKIITGKHFETPSNKSPKQMRSKEEILKDYGIKDMEVQRG